MVTSGRVGAVINFNDAPDVVAVQRLARQSRLKIPLLVSLDILHGFRTTFPVPLAAAATFDPDLVRRAATAQARETAAMGVQWTFAPMVDISRDPRWGRIVEGAGEDPFLGSAMAAAQVEGFKAGGLATSPKHFAGYGAAEGGRDYDAAQIPPGELRDAFLPPFRAALRAGSDTIMAALTALNGVPAGVNRWLLTDVLRGEWGFDGFVVSDWAGLQELIGHGVAGNPAEAARKALLAGVDMDMMSGFYATHLADEVRAGSVPLTAPIPTPQMPSGASSRPRSERSPARRPASHSCCCRTVAMCCRSESRAPWRSSAASRPRSGTHSAHMLRAGTRTRP
jgi:beta-glucosidase